MNEENQNLRPGCSPDYQIFCERIDPKMFIQTPCGDPVLGAPDGAPGDESVLSSPC